MIYVFNQNELFQALLSNENKDACPFWDAILEEKLGGEFHFTFTVPSFHPVAKQLQEKWYVATKDPEGTFQLFIIQEIEDTHGEQATKTVFCEHAIVELLDEIIEDQFINDRLSSQAVTTVLTGTRWQLGTVNEGQNRHNYTIRFKSVLQALDKIFERWGREARFRVVIAENRIQGRFIDLFIQRGTNTGKRFDFESDLTEIIRTTDAREIKTALWGRGSRIAPEGEENFQIGEFDEDETNRVNFKSVVWGQGKDFLKPAGQGWVGSETARERWGRVTSGGKRHLFGVVTFTDIEDPEQLLQATADALKVASQPKVTYRANAIDLFALTGQHFHEIRMGDTVKIIDKDLEIRLEARVIARKLDLNFPELVEWVFGNYRPVFTDSFERVRSEISRQVSEVNLGGDFISRGEQIKTEWLEGTIDTLRNAVVSGGGTVTMTEGEGLLVTDKPLDQNPTKALRLLGGVLAIANSKIQGSNQWNWRTFGTGDGFTADLVTTGTMKFDRAKGGLLKLGGEIETYDQFGNPVYSNGVLELYDTEGQIVSEMNGDRRGFDRLTVGHLISPNVVTRNMTPEHHGDYILYVNHIWGVDDINDRDGRNSSQPFQSIQYALDQIPKFNEYQVSIIVDNNGGFGRTYNEEVLIDSFVGNGRINIYLGRRNRMNGSIIINHCSNFILIRTDPVWNTNTQVEKAWITNINVTGHGVVFSQCCTRLEVVNIVVLGQNLPPYGIDSRFGGYTFCNQVEVYGVTNACMLAGYGHSVFVQNCVGWGTTRGLYAYGGYFLGTGTAPAGTTNFAGAVGGQNFVTNFNYQAGVNPNAPAVVRRTTTWTNNDHGSWYSTVGGWFTTVYQGKRPTDPPIWYGVIFFNTRSFAELKNANGTPRTIISVRLKARRTNNTGENTSRRPLVHWNAQTSKGTSINTLNNPTRSNVGFLWGEEKWITLPVVFGERFRDGQARSLVFFDGSNTADYMRFEGDFVLEIVHE